MNSAEREVYIGAMEVSLPNVVKLSTLARVGLGKLLGEDTGA
jgi:hypothetical protein